MSDYHCSVACKALLDMSVKPRGENERVMFGCLAHIEPLMWRDDGICRCQKCIDKRRPKKGWRKLSDGFAERENKI